MPLTARIERAISLLLTHIQRGGWCGLYCAHRATTASPWGLCEHRDHASCLALSFQACSVLSRDGGWLIFYCARPTKGVLDRALREHRRSSGSIPSSVLRARRTVCLLPRIVLRPCVARAQGTHLMMKIYREPLWRRSSRSRRISTETYLPW